MISLGLNIALSGGEEGDDCRRALGSWVMGGWMLARTKPRKLGCAKVAEIQDPSDTHDND